MKLTAVFYSSRPQALSYIAVPFILPEREKIKETLAVINRLEYKYLEYISITMPEHKDVKELTSVEQLLKINDQRAREIIAYYFFDYNKIPKTQNVQTNKLTINAILSEQELLPVNQWFTAERKDTNAFLKRALKTPNSKDFIHYLANLKNSSSPKSVKLVNELLDKNIHIEVKSSDPFPFSVDAVEIAPGQTLLLNKSHYSVLKRHFSDYCLSVQRKNKLYEQTNEFALNLARTIMKNENKVELVDSY